MANQFKSILLGVTGASRLQAAELVGLLVKAGARSAGGHDRGRDAFRRPGHFQALSGKPVRPSCGMAQPQRHGAQSTFAATDVILIAPASAISLAKLAHGPG